MLYELINPSDECTLEADSLGVAALAALLLSPQFGVKAHDETVAEADGYFFAFLGAAEAFWERWGDPDKFAAAHREELAACLESFAYVSADERRWYQRALELIDDPAKRKLFREEHEDRTRSSVNAICKAAWHYAEKLRQTKAAPTKPAKKARKR